MVIRQNLEYPLGMVVSKQPLDSGELEPPVVDHIVTASCSTSLFDVLHRDCTVLFPQDIAFISIRVLRALSFLHQHDETLGVCLTSRRVVLDAMGSVKLRRFGTELIARHGVSSDTFSPFALSTTGSYRTVYDMMACNEEGEHKSGLTSATQDLFAFGVLLLEMCTGEKPTSEIVNKVSRSRQLDPVFYAIIRSTLRVGGFDFPPPLELSDDLSKQFLLADASQTISADSLLALITERFLAEGCDSEGGDIGVMARSSASFPTFLHADRYFAVAEQMRVDAALKDRSSHAEVMVKRLEIVEQELVDEQKNFEVLVQQFEHMQREKIAIECTNGELRALVQTLNAKISSSTERMESLGMLSEEQATRLALADESQHDQQRRIHSLGGERLKVMNENQQLVIEILQLKNDRTRILELKRGVEFEREQLQHKVGGEREHMEDLQGRLDQAIHRLRDEQIARRRAEIQSEAASKQLQQLEDERCRYSLALWQSPTAGLDAKETPAMVIALKDREAQRLADQLEAAQAIHRDLETRIELVLGEKRAVEGDRQALVGRLEALQIASNNLEGDIAVREREKIELRRETELTRAEIAVLKQRIAQLEQQLEQQEAATRAAENARRLRQCLTPNCDAPTYLVGTSGYCKECEERTRRTPVSSSATSKQRHRRHRSLDSASSPRFAPHAHILSRQRNAEVVRIVQTMEEPPRGEEYLSLTEVEAADRDKRQRLDSLKQLAALLKADDALKDDLPECEAVKVTLELMHAYRASAGFQLEACKLLSLSVFNHDRNRVIVAAGGAIELVLAAMKRFDSDVRLQEACCIVLINLAHNCGGGIDAVLQLMQSQPKIAGVQKRCCWALLTLAGSDDMCEGVAARGGVGAILAAMLNCTASDEVQYYGSWALLNLVSGTPTLQQFARREGVVEVVEAARACFPDHSGIQEKTREILDVLCC